MICDNCGKEVGRTIQVTDHPDYHDGGYCDVCYYRLFNPQLKSGKYYRIVSDGTVSGTKIYTMNGEQLRGITSFKIEGTLRGLNISFEIHAELSEFEIENIERRE